MTRGSSSISLSLILFMRTNLAKEAIAGITTFFTMAYIIIVNPAILATPGTGMDFNGVLTATVLLCFTMTLLMGLYARLPFAVAPGMGINAFFTFTIILGQKVPWQTALGIVFWAGVLFLLISYFPLRETIARGIPRGLRTASACGIGIFLTFIGLKNAGLVISDPVTFVKFGTLGRESLLSLVGLAICSLLLRKKSPFAFLVGILAVTLLAFTIGLVPPPLTYFSQPDFHSVFFKADLLGALQWGLAPAIVALLFTDLFDSISTFIGVSQACCLTDKKGEPRNLREGLIVDSWATLLAGLFGTSSGTAYIESAAGIEAGGRTGLTSVFTALCFLPCFFLAPIAAAVPPFATAPVLIIVGGLMFRSAQDLPFNKWEELFPCFLTIVLIPLTFSITQGILWGFLSHSVLFTLSGRRKEITPILWVLTFISAALLYIEARRHG